MKVRLCATLIAWIWRYRPRSLFPRQNSTGGFRVRPGQAVSTSTPRTAACNFLGTSGTPRFFRAVNGRFWSGVSDRVSFPEQLPLRRQSTAPNCAIARSPWPNSPTLWQGALPRKRLAAGRLNPPAARTVAGSRPRKGGLQRSSNGGGHPPSNRSAVVIFGGGLLRVFRIFGPGHQLAGFWPRGAET